MWTIACACCVCMYLRVLHRAKYVNTSDYDGHADTCACVFDVIVACGSHHSYFSIWRSEGLGEDAIGAAVFGCYECSARACHIICTSLRAHAHKHLHTCVSIASCRYNCIISIWLVLYLLCRCTQNSL